MRGKIQKETQVGQVSSEGLFLYFNEADRVLLSVFEHLHHGFVC